MGIFSRAFEQVMGKRRFRRTNLAGLADLPGLTNLRASYPADFFAFLRIAREDTDNPTIMKLFLLTLFTLMAAFCSGQTEKQKDSAARNLAPIADSAIVYIMRPTSFGSAIKMDIHCDSVLIG